MRYYAESSDLDRYGLKAVVDSVRDITKTFPHKLFERLFKATLEYRLTEDTFSRVRERVTHPRIIIFESCMPFSSEVHFYSVFKVHFLELRFSNLAVFRATL